MNYIINILKVFLILLALLFIQINGLIKDNKVPNENKWAVIVVGSNTWENYRHQADACHAYHVLRETGIPKENIITMMYDDIAYNTENPFPGKIFNGPYGKDVYEGVIIDYKGKDVSPANFRNILLGNESAMKHKGSGKVLKSGPQDHVFIYFTDHGDLGVIIFPNSHISYRGLHKILQEMNQKKRYGKLLFYLESCHSGSMFTALPKNMNIYATVASDAQQNSYACYCQEKDLPCLGDQFSVTWIENTEYNDIKKITLEQQFEQVKKSTISSTVERFGDRKMGSMKLSDFFGNIKRKLKPQGKQYFNYGENVSSREADFYYLNKKLNETTPGSEEGKKIAETIINLIKVKKLVKHKTEQIINMLAETEEDKNDILVAKSLPKEEQGECFDNAINVLMKECHKTDKQREYGYQHSQKLINLCSQPKLSEEEIVKAIKYACNEMKEDEVNIDENEDCWMGDNLCLIFCKAKGDFKNKTLTGHCVDEKCVCN